MRVRLLVDDLYTIGGDELFRGLAAFPNVEVRLFNPFCCGRTSLINKYVASLADFGRLNHRMHNKLFIADGAMVVAGGRNMADEYFMRSATDNFVDMDAFMIGAVVPQLQAIFDTTGTAATSIPSNRSSAATLDGDALRDQFNHLVEDGEQMTSWPLPPDRHPRLRPAFGGSRFRAGSASSGARPLRLQTHPKRSPPARTTKRAR